MSNKEYVSNGFNNYLFPDLSFKFNLVNEIILKPKINLIIESGLKTKISTRAIFSEYIKKNDDLLEKDYSRKINYFYYIDQYQDIIQLGPTFFVGTKYKIKNNFNIIIGFICDIDFKIYNYIFEKSDFYRVIEYDGFRIDLLDSIFDYSYNLSLGVSIRFSPVLSRKSMR